MMLAYQAHNCIISWVKRKSTS